VRRVRDAEGVERGGESGGGIPLPRRLGGLGEHRKLPQRGPGRSPGRKRILVHFELEKTNLVMTNLIFFCHFYSAYLESNLQGYSFDIFSHSLGARPLRPPLATPMSRAAAILMTLPA